jgi:hypothetical protein
MSNVANIRAASGDADKSERKIKASMALQQQIETLKELIARPPTNSRVVEWSPKLAEHVLTNLNVGNRNQKPAKIKKYAADMTEGWGLTGDTIKFGNDGLLKDGQNRLAASVRANKPFLSHVVFGIDRNLFSRMDIGKNRTGADVFHIAKIPHPNHAAATVRWLLILTSDNPTNRGAQFSNEELYSAHREKFDGDRIENSIRHALRVKRFGHPVGPLAALHYVFAERDAEKADAFFEEWDTGRVKKVRAPTKALQLALQAEAAKANNRVHENVRNALIIKAWNAYLARRTVSKADMRYSLGDPLPEIAG